MKRLEIEDRREHYRTVITQWSTNLQELDNHPTYRLLTAGDMAGSTGRSTNFVIEESAQLWAWVGDLRNQLEQVDQLITQRSILNNTDCLLYTSDAADE